MLVINLCIALIMMCQLVESRHKMKGVMNFRHNFVKKGIPAPSHTHEVIIYVKQRNLDVLEEFVQDRSNPDSPAYQQWMSFDQVGDLTSNPNGYHRILQWLNSEGVTVKSTTIRRDFILASAPVSVWERALDTKFSLWEDEHHSQQIFGKLTEQATNIFVRASSYSVPDDQFDDIGAIFNTVQSPPIFWGVQKPTDLHNDGVSSDNVESFDEKHYSSISHVDLASYDGTSSISSLRSVYGIPPNVVGSIQASQTVFEAGAQAFSLQDLRSFQQYFGLPIQDPILRHTSSVSASSCASSTSFDCSESNLDVQYVMAVAPGSKTTLWYSSNPTVSSFVSFLLESANTTQPSLVQSISYGAPEQYVDADTIDAFNTQAMKLAAMGVTIVVSSGDNGASKMSSTTCSCAEDSSSSASRWSGLTSWAGSGYFPSFPATCPYVTAVGATQGRNSNGYAATSTSNEISCSSSSGGVITSGGGFSTYYPTPSWQQSSTGNYFANVDSQPVSGFNPRGRAIPDVSFSGVFYPTYVGGTLQYLFGTSASAPVFAGLVSLINAGRLAAGKSSVGFLNPTLYAASNSNKFNDITSGNNKCCASNSPAVSGTCCSAGFVASSGWDPVTGLGSVTLPNLAAIFNTTLLVAVPTAAPTPAPSSQYTRTFCDPYTSFGSNSFYDCAFQVCSTAAVTLSLCTNNGGVCSGDTVIQLLDNTGAVRFSNDDYCQRCSQLSFRQSASICQRYTVRQFCYLNTACSGTLSITNGVVLKTPTSSPSNAPPSTTVSPTISASAAPTSIGNISYCNGFTGIGSESRMDCQFSVCNTQPVTVSACSNSRGVCDGDTTLQLLDNSGNILLSNDDYCGQCSQIRFLQNVGFCVSYVARLSCFGSGVCSSVLAITNGNIVAQPSTSPSSVPTTGPTLLSTGQPLASPTTLPSSPPFTTTLSPTLCPSKMPSEVPTFTPTEKPTIASTQLPTLLSTLHPSKMPSEPPTFTPTEKPTIASTLLPTMSQTTLSPVARPTIQPTSIITASPSTGRPSLRPSASPTVSPKNPTEIPSPSPTTNMPTVRPSGNPSLAPSRKPTAMPTVRQPPTARPSVAPTTKPSAVPTDFPTNPTVEPTETPTSQAPTVRPSGNPSLAPSRKPTAMPTVRQPPTARPSVAPTTKPSAVPTDFPTNPTVEPTETPTSQAPTVRPTRDPTAKPTRRPSRTPTKRGRFNL